MNLAVSAIDSMRLVALVGFAFATLWTPGPNNILLASSGANFGFRRTVPHALGVFLGFAAMLFTVALGLGEVFKAEAALREGLRAVGVAVLLFLAWRIATAKGSNSGVAAIRPFRFYEAVAFQWINPKAWAMSISVSAAYVTGAAPLFESALCGLVFAVIGIGSSFGWTAFGVQIGRIMKTELHRRVLGIFMGVLLAGSAIFLVFDDLAIYGI